MSSVALSEQGTRQEFHKSFLVAFGKLDIARLYSGLCRPVDSCPSFVPNHLLRRRQQALKGHGSILHIATFLTDIVEVSGSCLLF